MIDLQNEILSEQRNLQSLINDEIFPYLIDL